MTVSTKVGRLLVPGDGSADPDGFRGDPSLVRRRDYTAEGVYRSGPIASSAPGWTGSTCC